MKNFKRLSAVIVAVMLLVLSAFSSFATTTIDDSTPITFSVTCVGKPGYTFTVYKVADLVSTSTSPFETKYESLVPEISPAILAGETSQALSVLDGLQDMPDTVVVIGTYNSSDSETATFTKLDKGIYYIKATNYPAGVKSVTNSVVALPYYDGVNWIYSLEGIALATKVNHGEVNTVKTITNSTKNNVNFTEVNLGDTVNFEIKSDTAGSSSMKLNSYNVTDVMGKGFSLDENSFNIALLDNGGTKVADLTKGTDYTVTVTDKAEGKDTRFTVALTSSFLAKEDMYANNVTHTSITYSASLNNYSVIGTEGNPNTEVNLIYSNKNNVQNTVEGNTVYAYTFGVEITKIDEKDERLAGAEFSLFTTNEDALAQINAIGTGVSDDNGVVKFYNSNNEELRLASGKYYALETKAPKNYTVYGKIIEIDLAVGYSSTFTNGTYVTTAPLLGVATATVANYPVFLPVTGGTGVIALYVVCGVSLVGAVVFFAVYFNKRSKGNN